MSSKIHLVYVQRQRKQRKINRFYTRYSVVSNSACTVQTVVQGYSVFKVVVNMEAFSLLQLRSAWSPHRALECTQNSYTSRFSYSASRSKFPHFPAPI